MTFGFGFSGVARLCSGLWSYLAAKADGRAAVALERERNLGTVEAIKALPFGAELLENEPNGRLRLIRMPNAHWQSSSVEILQVEPFVIMAPVTPPQLFGSVGRNGDTNA